MINHSQILLDPSTFLPFNALHLCKLHQLTTGKDGIAFMTSYKSPKIKCGFAFPLHSWTLREVSSDPNKASKDENKVAIKLFLLAIKHVMQWMSSPTLLCLKFLSFLCVFYYENNPVQLYFFRSTGSIHQSQNQHWFGTSWIFKNQCWDTVKIHGWPHAALFLRPTDKPQPYLTSISFPTFNSKQHMVQI